MGRSTLEPLPAAAVSTVAAVAALLLLAVAGRYGYHRDELYFLAAGDHLAWGYVDQPPLTPLVARFADAVRPGSVAALRVLPALSTCATVLVSALLARELGATRRGQVLAAAAVAGGGFVLGAGHLLATATFDLLAWTTLLWIFSRLLRTGDTRLWIPFGAIAGVATLNKNLVPLLGVALLVGLLVERRFDLMRSRQLALGALLAAAIASPHLAWQVTNGWPQLDMARALAERLAVENRVTLLPSQVLLLGPAVAVLLPAGVRWFLSSDGTAFRPLLWAWPAGLVAALVAAGRPYYVLPLTAVVMLAGLSARERSVAAEPGRGPTGLVALVAVNAVTTIPLALPVLPVSALSDELISQVNPEAAETVGWPELTRQVAGVVADLPADGQRDVVLLTSSYGEAGALDRFGPGLGLPPAHSPHNGYADFRRPTADDATVVAVRWSEQGVLAGRFDSCDEVARVDNGRGVENMAQGEPILVCRGLRGSWNEVWAELRFLS